MVPQSREEMIDRTIRNLEFVEHHAEASKLFEVTQLLNSFLLAVLYDWDDIEAEWSSRPQHSICWPDIVVSHKNMQVRDCIGKMRDAFAHGLFVVEGDADGVIEVIHFWTCADKTNRQRVDWDATVTVDAAKEILRCLHQHAKLHSLQPKQRRTVTR